MRCPKCRGSNITAVTAMCQKQAVCQDCGEQVLLKSKSEKCTHTDVTIIHHLPGYGDKMRCNQCGEETLYPPEEDKEK